MPHARILEKDLLERRRRLDPPATHARFEQCELCRQQRQHPYAHDAAVAKHPSTISQPTR